MDPITISTASAKIAELLSVLSKKAKDRETAALVQEIQSNQAVVYAALREEQSKSLDLDRNMFQMEKDHSKAIADRDAKITKLDADLTEAKRPKSGMMPLIRR